MKLDRAFPGAPQGGPACGGVVFLACAGRDVTENFTGRGWCEKTTKDCNTLAPGMLSALPMA
jgi:hypothetical protein